MAWLQNDEEIQFPGDGSNIIPTIHIKDLVTLIKRIIDIKPVQNYFLAVDRSENRTLKNIVKSIADSVGNGLIYSCNASIFESYPKYSEMMFNVKLKTSKFFDDILAKDKETKLQFNWESEVIIAMIVMI